MARLPTSLLSTLLVSSLALLSALPHVTANDTTYVIGTDAAGVNRRLADDRYPALYTGDFGDCLPGGSLLNVTQFDAAYYADNMTVLFHLTGTTSLRNESIMLYISVDAYGEDRFDITFNPCTANIKSMCPMSAASPLSGEAIIPVGSADVAGIPPIALQIPDFEGSASIRIFANSTQTQIGCFRAVMKNGQTFSHPEAVSPVLAIFTFVALIASFATAIYGVNVPEMRTHHGHSLPVLVVFEVFQSIFFSGALNLNWPSILVAWWSNFAWSAGMIYTKSMTDSINRLIGDNLGNSSQVGGAGSTIVNNNGGLQQQIYGRSVASIFTDDILHKRASSGSDGFSTTYTWAGQPVAQGLQVPGNWTGFSGELSELGIPASDAFMFGFLWFLVLIVAIIFCTAAFKWVLEGLAKVKLIREDRLALFRSHWLGYLAIIACRTMFIAIPMMFILTIFQFAMKASAGVTAIAAIVFITFFCGGVGVSAYACFFRLRLGRYESSPDPIHFQSSKIMKVVPWVSAVRASSLTDTEKGVTTNKIGTIPMFRIHHVNKNAEGLSVHEDPDYIKRFGWLTAHFRRTRWWFFAVWVVYQFVRACFIGGAGAHPETQVIGLFVVEIIALVGIIVIRPFEGSRNTTLAVYMLSFSKVATAGLSIAFLPSFNLARIPTTVVGVVIIVIQGFLTIAMMILIILGAISSYMSLTRTQESFKPRSWVSSRVKYFQQLQKSSPDVPSPKPVKVVEDPNAPKQPYFSVNSVRRAPKIEDEDEDQEYYSDMPAIPHPARASAMPVGRSRPVSIRSNFSQSNIPYGARVHRASWSSRDFEDANYDPATRGPSRATSRRSTMMHSQTPPPNIVRPAVSLQNMRSTTIAEESARSPEQATFPHAG